MKAIMVMFDSLNRAMLQSYGCDWTRTPNFCRLAKKATQFENCYVGSMPCMPARRELHTGRPNFLHRSWGPLEPFDDSMPEILKNHGICSHLVSDHQHYWEDGGGTYHTRYSSWECIRGQEGDPWKENLAYKLDRRSVFKGKSEFLDKVPVMQAMNIHDQVNRTYQQREELTPQAQTFEAGLEFIRVNHGVDNWFLQIESFDPHEPFFCDQKYRDHFSGPLQGEDAVGADWPPYMPVQEGEAVVQTVRNRYAALLEKCDASLGKVLDAMDNYGLWKDTMLIVCTDHGFLLGEHDWWGKSTMPCYNEIAHTPLYIYDPRFDCAGKHCDALCQMPDLSATILEFFSQPIPKNMTGKPLRGAMEHSERPHDYVVFGFRGDEVNITDGKYLYMRAPVNPEVPCYDYTLMPTHMRCRFSVKELSQWEQAESFSFTKGLKTMKIRCAGNTRSLGAPLVSRLYDLEKDPGELHPIEDEAVTGQLVKLISEYMRETDAPEEAYARYGIPKENA